MCLARPQDLPWWSPFSYACPFQRLAGASGIAGRILHLFVFCLFIVNSLTIIADPGTCVCVCVVCVACVACVVWVRGCEHTGLNYATRRTHSADASTLRHSVARIFIL